MLFKRNTFDNSIFQSSGFTAIELLISVTILIITFAITLPISSNFQSITQINEQTAQIMETLRMAKQRSEAGFNDSSHGVYLEINPEADDRVILYEGDNYSTRTQSLDRVLIVNSKLTISTSLPSPDIIFSKGIGNPNNAGTITLTNNDDGQSNIIDVNIYGIINKL